LEKARSDYTSISEYEVRGGKFFQPEPVFAACVTELIVRREHHQIFMFVPLFVFFRLSIDPSRRSDNTQRGGQTIGQRIADTFDQSARRARLQAGTIKMQELHCSAMDGQ